MSRSAYIIAVLGESPSVLSELLWWLCVEEHRPIAGMEVWATGSGAGHLAELIASPAWAELERATGPLPGQEPAGTEPGSHYGFRIHTLDEDGRTLDDVRTQGESSAVSATLHDRVRTLRRTLPPSIDIIGSLAGGRKTVSAALQTAFCLQAGPTDRLVHVLLEPTFEYALRQRNRLREFCMPSDHWAWECGVPVDEQIIVYDVPFPRIRHLVPRRLSAALDTLDWKDVWPVLESNMAMKPEARLFREDEERWRFEIVDTRDESHVWSTDLHGRLGAVMAAMASLDDGAKAADVADWIDANNVGWMVPAGPGDNAESRTGTIRNAASKLRDAFETLPVGLEDFAPPPRGFSVPRVRVYLEVD